MEIFISIDGVLRNTIQKFEYHYNEFFLNSDVESTEVEDNFEYKINPPIKNDNLFNYFTFHSQEEFENFLFIEFPIEIFGHAGLSYSTTFTDLNKLIYDNKDINFTLVGMDELGKSKPATLFFLSKNGFLGSNIKFINSKNLNKEWGKCDLWITDDERVLTSCPKQKTVIKFNTVYNQHFTNIKEINKLTEIDKSWLKYSENFITSILKRLVNRVK
jgi:hypothetical protein